MAINKVCVSKNIATLVLNERCPYCKKRVFECEGHKWCNGYPDCKYEEEQKEKERQEMLRKRNY